MIDRAPGAGNRERRRHGRLCGGRRARRDPRGQGDLQRHGGHPRLRRFRRGGTGDPGACPLLGAPEILESTDDEEARKEAIRQRADELVPKHIIIDDILATINYLNCLAHDVGTTDDIDHLGNRRIRSVGELLQNQFPHRLFPHGAGHPRAHDPAGPGYGRHHPAGADQHPPGGGGDQGVLWLLPAVPVHGSDQPAGRTDPQAPPFGPRPRRPVP